MSRPKEQGRFRSLMAGVSTTLWNRENGPTVVQVRQSAHEGCHLCTLILTTWLVGRSDELLGREGGFTAPQLRGQEFEDEKFSLEERRHYLSGQAFSSHPGRFEMRFGFNLLSTEDIRPGSSAQTPSIDAMAPAEVVAKYWLQECLTNHGPTCSTGQPDPLLPSRVIDVRGRVHGDDPFSPFLFESHGMRAKYATLSYCWGHCEMFKTTKESNVERCQSIPLAALPRTFRDAVSMTAMLGLWYLWIDALCILQDSDEGCQKELGLMAQIYVDANITIAAVGATGADSGFPLNRNKLAMMDCRVSPTLLISAQVEGQEKILELGTLHERAWCFQEVQLAPRLLSCGRKELYFQCRSGAY